ncbi:MAG: hypothetical protein IPM42_16485 [Saprospiraceae bacterium]|nr:hypothetical protein [Saprospiraceae bacterium]
MSSSLKNSKIFFLSPEQEQILKSSGMVASIQYLDIKMAAQTIANSVLKNYTDGERAMIVCADKGVRTMLISMLQEMKFLKYVPDITPENEPNENEMSCIRAASVIHDEVTKHDDHEPVEFILKKLKEKAHHYYSQLNEKVFGNVTLKDIIIQYALYEKNPAYLYLKSTCDISTLTFEKQEFSFMYDQIATAQILYQKGHINIKTTFEYIHLKKTSINPQYAEKTLVKLSAFKDKTEELRNQYYILINEINREFRAVLLNEYLGVIHKIDELKFAALQMASQPKSSQKTGVLDIFNLFKNQSLENKKNQDYVEKLYHEINNWLSKEQLFIQSDFAYDNELLLKFTEDASILIENWKKQINQQVIGKQKSLNKLNAGDIRPAELEHKLELFIQELNQSDLFSNQFELNTLSFIKQAEYTAKLSDLLGEIIFAIQNNQLYQDWFMFYEEQDDRFKNLFKYLGKINQEHWCEIFENWYMDHLIEKYISWMPDFSESDLENIENIILENHYKSVEVQDFKLRQSIKEILNQFKNEQKDLYNAIYKKKKLVDTTWKELITRHTAYISSVFPVMILDNDHLKDLPEGYYQHLYYIHYQDYNPEILQNFKTIHTYTPFNKESSSASDMKLLLHSHEQNIPLAEQGLGDRLSTAKKLAKNILFLNQHVRLFQMKTANIISFASDPVNGYLWELHRENGIKEITISTTLYTQLVECLLETERPPYLIIEDYLINGLNFENMLWQRKVIEDLRIAGFTILNINTSKLHYGDENTVKEILQIISDIKSSSTFHQPINEPA